LGDFNGIGTPGVTIAARGPKKKSVNTDFQFYESRQKPVQFEIFSRNFASRLYCKIALLWFSKKWIIVM
jgi:hypothetical protein